MHTQHTVALLVKKAFDIQMCARSITTIFSIAYADIDSPYKNHIWVVSLSPL